MSATQNAELLARLLDISPDALTDKDARAMPSGIGRLASRVGDLRADGWPVRSVLRPVRKKNGSIARIGFYWLDPGAKQGSRPYSEHLVTLKPGEPLPVRWPKPDPAPPAPGRASCPEHGGDLVDCLDRHQLELF